MSRSGGNRDRSFVFFLLAETQSVVGLVSLVARVFLTVVRSAEVNKPEGRAVLLAYHCAWTFSRSGIAETVEVGQINMVAAAERKPLGCHCNKADSPVVAAVAGSSRKDSEGVLLL